MKNTCKLFLVLILLSGCTTPDKEQLKKEIVETEKAFETMAKEKGIAEAFFYFADENAVISRGGDSVITGKEGIKNFYNNQNLKNASVTWAPDFVEVSSSGDLGYTYGKYCWTFISEKGDTTISRGIFHTVWKKQSDGTWRYVWD